jgi:hypothetical protein
MFDRYNIVAAEYLNEAVGRMQNCAKLFVVITEIHSYNSDYFLIKYAMA